MPPLPPQRTDEDRFKKWYADRAKKLNLDPNPDDPKHFYDYRAAFKAGAEAEIGNDGEWHWPSKFKLKGHPNEVVNGVNTRTGEAVAQKKPWTPPDYATPSDEKTTAWTPPDYAKENSDEVEPAETSWEKFSRLVDTPQVIKDFGKKVSDYGSQNRLAHSPGANVTGEYSLRDNLLKSGAQLRGFFAGAMGGYSDGSGGGAISTLLNPLDLAAELTGYGAVTALKHGYKGYRALRKATQALSVPVIAHGVGQTFGEGSTLSERAMGVAEMAGGIAGFHFPHPKGYVAPAKKVKTPKTPEETKEAEINRIMKEMFGVDDGTPDVNVSDDPMVPPRGGSAPPQGPIAGQKLLGPGPRFSVSPDGTVSPYFSPEGLPKRSTEVPYQMEPTPTRTEAPPSTPEGMAARELEDYNRRIMAKERQRVTDEGYDVPDNPIAQRLEQERLLEEHIFRMQQGLPPNPQVPGVRPITPDTMRPDVLDPDKGILGDQILNEPLPSDDPELDFAQASENDRLGDRDIRPPEPFRSRATEGEIEPVKQTNSSDLNRYDVMGDDWTKYTLDLVGRHGVPGLSTKSQQTDSWSGGSQFEDITYRAPNGEPIATALIKKDIGNNSWEVVSFAADKKRGLLYGRAVKAVGKELIRREATTPQGVISPDTENIMRRAGLVEGVDRGTRRGKQRVNRVNPEHDIMRPGEETAPASPVVPSLRDKATTGLNRLWDDERGSAPIPDFFNKPEGEQPRAKFAMWWDAEPSIGTPARPQYNLIGGENDGSTVSAEQLTEMGIPIPETPPHVPGQKPSGYPGVKEEPDFFAKAQEDARDKAASEGILSHRFDPTGGEPPAKFSRTNKDARWVEAKTDADRLGINTDEFDRIEDLEWAITQKVAQETIRTGKNPLHIDPSEGILDSREPDHSRYDPRIGESGHNFNSPNLETFLKGAPVKELNRARTELANKLDLMDKDIKDPNNRFIKGRINRSIILGKRKLAEIDKAIELRSSAGENAFEDLQFSRKRGYEDLTPERYKRYSVFDENDNLIHKTYDEAEAQRYADENDGFVKDTGENPPEDIQSMRVPNTGTRDLPNIAIGGANEPTIKALASSLYTRNPDVIAAKELIQNSNDEHRISGIPNTPLKFITTYGDEHPITKQDTNSLILRDKGRGLTPDQLYTVFTDIGISGKGNEENASGGFGFAKASPLAGGDYVKVESIVLEGGENIKYSFEGDPTQLMDQKKGVTVKRSVAKSGESTGLKVQVYYNKANSNIGSVERMVKSIGTHSFESSPIEFFESFGPSSTRVDAFMNDAPGAPAPTVSITRNPKPPLIDTLETPNATIKFHYIEGTPDIGYSNYQLHILNKGLWQQGLGRSYGTLGSIPNVPESIYVDVISKVEEGEKGYPFGLNREQLQQDPTMVAIDKWIDDNVVSGALAKQRDRLQRLYDGMENIGDPNLNVRPTVFFDAGDRLTPIEREKFINSPIVRDISQTLDHVIDEAIMSVGNMSWATKLEKTGIVLAEEGYYGLHAPNPASQGSRSLIVINPFAHASDRSGGSVDPLSAALKTVVTALHEVGHIGVGRGDKRQTSPADYAHPGFGRYDQTFKDQIQTQAGGNHGHETPWVQRLGDIYATYGPENFDDAVDQVRYAITDDTGGYSPEFQELLQIYQDSRGRPEVTEDLLSRTGIKQETPKKRKRPVSGTNRPNGEGTPPKEPVTPRPRQRGTPAQRASAKLILAIQDAIPLREMQEDVYRTERARRFSAFEKAGKEGGIAGARKQMHKLRGEFDKINSEMLHLGEEDIDTLFSTVHDSSVSTPEKARGYSALFKLLEGGPVPHRTELAVLDSVFGGGMASKIIELHGGIGAVGIKVGRTVNTMKAMSSSVDVSAPMRQGLGLIHRKEWRDSFTEMFKYLGNKEYYDAAMQAIQERPYYKLGRESGLFIADPKALLQAEEAFMDNYVHHFPVIRDLVGASERAFTGFLNKLRADTFDNLINDARDMGHEPFTTKIDAEGGAQIVTSKVADNIAKYINASTGRGGLGRLEKMAPELNMVLWSPRLISSRLTILNPKYYHDLDPFTRQEALKSLLAIAVFGSTMVTLGGLAGGEVSLDPRSADFMKVRFGNKVLDPHGGFQQPIVAATRFITGQSEIGNQARLLTLGRFGINKLSPAASLGFDILTAREFSGQGAYEDRYGNTKTIQRETLNRFLPIITQDIEEIILENPGIMLGTTMGAASAFGQGVQDYPERTQNTGAGRIRRMDLNLGLD